MNSEEEAFSISRRFEIYMDRTWRWRHRSLPEKINNFPWYAKSVGKRCQSPFQNISYRFWVNRLSNCSVGTKPDPNQPYFSSKFEYLADGSKGFRNVNSYLHKIWWTKSDLRSLLIIITKTTHSFWIKISHEFSSR